MPGTPGSPEIRALTTIISALVLPRLPCYDLLERLDVRIPIATSIDDFTALAEVLEGEYRPSRGAVVAAVLCGSFFCLVVPPGIAAVLLADRVPLLSFASAVLLIMLVLSPWFGAKLVLEVVCTVVIDREAFERRSPVGIWSWRASVYELASVELDANPQAPFLELASREGHKVQLVLVPELCHKLKALYPFLRCPDEPITVPDWMRWPVYIALALTVSFTAALAIWVWKQGFLG